MSDYKPKISTVLNVYNEEKNIYKCLYHIRNQDYPQDKIEIIIVDDLSNDKTLEIAKKFNVKIVKSGFKNREKAKSIGIEHAKGELLLLMDADVFLLSKKFVKRSVELLNTHRDASAVQCIRWNYRKSDYIINRYCNLFGSNDPLVYFLGKRGTLMATEDEWIYKDTIISEERDYVLAKYNSRNLPTMGAQGYIVRRNKIMTTTWKPYFFHMETALEMVENGDNKFILLKIPIEHRYVKSFTEYFTKLSRNTTLFLELRDYRKYDYSLSPLVLLIPLVLMMTFVVPLSQSIRGFIKKPDIAWFLHPIFCFTVPILYTIILLNSKLRKVS